MEVHVPELAEAAARPVTSYTKRYKYIDYFLRTLPVYKRHKVE